MSREISRAEAWEKVHEAFSQINFNAFDFNTIKESLLDYLKLYYPEFNNYIETDELIAIVELFAYVGELIAYRLDLNAHENFITTAEKKESVLRLAKLLSYRPTRNLPARGLVKITSIQTTEEILDSEGNNIGGKKILWNDPNNPNWKEQFLLILGRVLEQDFGNVRPEDRIQIDDVLFELYTLNNNPLSPSGKTVIPYTATSNGVTYPMELVPIALTEQGIEEKRPEVNGKLTIVYASDGLGDQSDLTGFMLLTKQGELQKREVTFDGITPNQTYEILVENINDTDVWVNNVDPTTREILTINPYEKILPHFKSSLRYGEWIEVDTLKGETILFNTTEIRNKYEVETLDNDQIRIIFGDGEFGNIPSGAFDIWFRTSANDDTVILKSAITDQVASFTYTDSLGSIQTITFTFSLVSSLLNGASSETIERIKENAPGVYYTQNRMVNGQDYNTFFLQDPSIVKVKAINRTFSGDSKYLAWHDPREYYEDVKLFGDDGALYWIEATPEEGNLIIVSSNPPVDVIINDYLEPLLSTTDFYAIVAPVFVGGELRRKFTPAEQTEIANAISNADTSPIIELYFSYNLNQWTVGPNPSDPDAIKFIVLTALFSGPTITSWEIRYSVKKLIAHSEQTKFWHTNQGRKIINYYTIDTLKDRFIVLSANKNNNRDTLLPYNINLAVLNQELLENPLPDAGLPDIHRLNVIPEDVTGDGIPDNIELDDLFDVKLTMTWGEMKERGYVDLATNFVDLTKLEQKLITTYADNDLTVYVNGIKQTFSGGELLFPPGTPTTGPAVIDSFGFTTIPNDSDLIEITITDYVYFQRETVTDRYIPKEKTDTVLIEYALDQTLIPEKRRNIRRRGRYPLNFMWSHYVERYNLVDPAATNIIDVFVVTKGYYLSLLRWLERQIDNQPQLPSTLQLQNTYSKLLQYRMLSDTVILHPGKFKILFGEYADPALRAKIKIVRSGLKNLTDNEIKAKVVNIVKEFFNIKYWNFGETFYFTELAASIHSNLGPEIESVVLVPLTSQSEFGDLYQIQAREDELFIADIRPQDIEIIDSITPTNIRQTP